MDVQATVRREVEHVLPQDLPKGGDDDDIRLPGRQLGHSLWRAQRVGLEQRQVALQRRLLDRRQHQLPPAPTWPVRLRDDAGYLVNIGQRLQCR